MIGFSTNQNSHSLQETNDYTIVKTNFSVPDVIKEVRLTDGITSKIMVAKFGLMI